MQRLSASGIRFYIDDFGTGHSSLDYLRRLPVAGPKIDGAFVSNITEDTGDAAIAHAVIQLARTLGVAVVAEGVETEDQLAFLRREGCEQAQGFLLGRPVEGQQVPDLLERGLGG